MASELLKLSDLMRFLEAKGVGKVQCGTCGQDTFDFFGEPTNQAKLGLLGFKPPKFDLSTVDVFDVMVLACANCREMRFFDRQRLSQWVEQNPPH